MTRKKPQPLAIKKESYIYMQFAQNIVHSVLKDLINGMPIHFRMLSSGETTVYEFTGNGISVTLNVEKQKGGKP